MMEHDDDGAPARPAPAEPDSGQAAVRCVLIALFALALGLVHAHAQFTGLASAEAMEHAQLARSLAHGEGFSTRCIRPADAGRLQRRAPSVALSEPLPDLRHGPVYPVLLALGFRVLDVPFGVAPVAERHAPESRVIVPLGILFTVATAAMVYLLGRRLFGEWVAVLGALAYSLMDPVQRQGIAGTPAALMSFLAASSCYAALAAVPDRRAEPGRRREWIAPAALAGVLCAGAALTRYGMLALAPALGLFLFLAAGPRRRAGVAAVFALAFALCLAPWLVRNTRVVGAPFGAAPASALHDAPGYEQQGFDRSLDPPAGAGRVAAAVRGKLRQGLRAGWDADLRTLGSGLAVCFFLVSFLRPVERRTTERLRWCLLIGVGLALAADGLVGSAADSRILTACLPLVTVYGTACFCGLAAALCDAHPGWPSLFGWLWSGLTALPLVLRLAGDPVFPYPPYHPPFIAHVCRLLGPAERIASDIPWAVAWYGERTGVLLPRTADEMVRTNALPLRVSALYLASGPSLMDPTPRGTGGPDWAALWRHQPPPGFAYLHGMTFPQGGQEQLFLADRDLWATAAGTNSVPTPTPSP